MAITKEQFNQFWKDSKRKNILNQYYYDYMYMQKLKDDINKVIELLESQDQDMLGNYFFDDNIAEKILIILKGDEEEND